MSDLNNNTKEFNLPAYVNIPLFLYQDHRLEKSSMLIAAFFYSLYTAGLKITASKNYLCAIVGIGKTQYFSTLNQLESLGYIKRSGFTNQKKIQWAYSPKSEIFVDETSSGPEPRTSVKSLNTSPVNRTKLVRDPEPILSGIPDTYIKEDTKDNKRLTTVSDPLSSSSFFSEKQTADLLSLKLPSDDRANEVFLEHCFNHIKKQVNDKSNFQRFSGLKKILKNLLDTQEHFKASSDDKVISKKIETDEEKRQRYAKERQDNLHRRN
jgi:hypothetical protein